MAETFQFEHVAEYIKASKDVMEIFKTMVGFLPKGEEADEAEKRLEQAEKALRASEAQLAQALGYQLCQCTFPPQIMLSTGRHPVHGNEIYKCERCGKQEPSEHKFAQMDRLKEQNDRLSGSSWTAARRGSRV